MSSSNYGTSNDRKLSHGFEDQIIFAKTGEAQRVFVQLKKLARHRSLTEPQANRAEHRNKAHSGNQSREEVDHRFCGCRQ